MLNEQNNSDVADPFRWLQRYFTQMIAEGEGHSVHVEWVEDDAGITNMKVVIERLGD